MGSTYVTVKIYNRNKTKFETKTLLVNSGATTYTWLREDFLRRLNIEPKKTRLFKTIEGRIIERAIGEAVVEYDDEDVTTVIVFANEKDHEVLGVYTLEGLGYIVDPITKQLKKVEAHLAV